MAFGATRIGILGTGGQLADRALAMTQNTGSPPVFTGSLSLSNTAWGAYNRKIIAVVMGVYRLSSAASNAQLFYKSGEMDMKINFADKLAVSIDGNSAKFTTTQTFGVNTWYTLKIWYDSTQATEADRLGLSVNGVDVSAFDSITYPTLNNVISSTTNQVNLFSDGSGDGGMYGYGYMPAFFSGSVPANSQIYGSGHPLPIEGLPGCWSIINSNGTDALGYDRKRLATWSHTGVATENSTLP